MVQTTAGAHMGNVGPIWKPVIPHGPHVGFPSGSHLLAQLYPSGAHLGPRYFACWGPQKN